MNTRFRTIGFLVAAALAATALAGTVQEFSLKRQVKEGQTYRFNLEGKIELDVIPGGVQIKGTTEERVIGVEENGNYTIESNTLRMVAIIGGVEQEAPSSPPTISVYNKRGEIVEMRGDEIDSAAYRMANLNTFVPKDGAVKVGDKWKHEIAANEQLGTRAIVAEYEVLGSETVLGIASVKIKSVVRESGGDESARAEATMWIDPRDGALVQAESKLINAPFPMAPMPINATIKMTRVQQ
jgi:hypothetical protein